MRANYNERLCESFRKSASAGTMANNEKNNGKNNAPSSRNSRTSGLRSALRVVRRYATSSVTDPSGNRPWARYCPIFSISGASDTE